MSTDEENRKLLVEMQMEASKNAMQDAELLLNEKRASGAAGRVYYSVFHAVSALLIHDGLRIKSHKGAYTMFCLHYVNNGTLPQKYGKWYRDLELMREESDYNCFYKVTVEDVQNWLSPAQEMIDTIAEMVKE